MVTKWRNLLLHRIEKRGSESRRCDTQGPNVGALIGFLLAEQSRRHGRRGPNHHVVMGSREIDEGSDHELDDLYLAFGVHHDVAGFDALVNHAVLVGVFERLTDPHNVAHLQSKREFGLPDDRFFKAVAIEIFHGDERRALFLTKFKLQTP